MLTAVLRFLIRFKLIPLLSAFICFPDISVTTDPFYGNITDDSDPGGTLVGVYIRKGESIEYTANYLGTNAQVEWDFKDGAIKSGKTVEYFLFRILVICFQLRSLYQT